LTSDPERWARSKAVLDAAPQLRLGAPTIGWLRAAYRSCAMVTSPRYSVSIRVPMLMFSAGNDQIVSTRATEAFSVQVKSCSHILLHGARHELLQEADPIRLRFWAAVDAYLGVNAAAA